MSFHLQREIFTVFNDNVRIIAGLKESRGSVRVLDFARADELVPIGVTHCELRVIHERGSKNLIFKQMALI